MGFKMKGSPAKMGGIKGTEGHKSALKMKMEAGAAKYKKESMAKMYKDSPVDKALVGEQENLPEELKAKIEASPAKDSGHGGHPGLTAKEASTRTHGGKTSEAELNTRKKANYKKNKSSHSDAKKRDVELIDRREERDNPNKKRVNKYKKMILEAQKKVRGKTKKRTFQHDKVVEERKAMRDLKKKKNKKATELEETTSVKERYGEKNKKSRIAKKKEKEAVNRRLSKEGGGPKKAGPFSGNYIDENKSKKVRKTPQLQKKGETERGRKMGKD